jgi:hypothetical protein
LEITTLNQPLYRYVFVDGEYRAVVTDWNWLKKHTYKELCELVEALNAKTQKE